MIKTLMIIRLGVQMPTQMEQKIFAKIIADPENHSNSAFTPIHGGIAVFVKTHMPAKRLTELFEEVSTKFHTILPVIIVDLDSRECSFNLDGCPNVANILTQFQPDQQDSVVNELTLDELLDRVSTKGLQNLSAAELERLKKLSEK